MCFFRITVCEETRGNKHTEAVIWFTAGLERHPINFDLSVSFKGWHFLSFLFLNGVAKLDLKYFLSLFKISRIEKKFANKKCKINTFFFIWQYPSPSLVHYSRTSAPISFSCWWKTQQRGRWWWPRGGLPESRPLIGTQGPSQLGWGNYHQTLAHLEDKDKRDFQHLLLRWILF